jgi:hypothetical protein
VALYCYSSYSTGGTCTVTLVTLLVAHVVTLVTMVYWWHMYCYSSYYALLVGHVVLLQILYSTDGTCTVTQVTRVTTGATSRVIRITVHVTPVE